MMFFVGFIAGTGLLWAFGFDPLFAMIGGIVAGVLGMFLSLTLDAVEEYFQDKHEFYKRNK